MQRQAAPGEPRHGTHHTPRGARRSRRPRRRLRGHRPGGPQRRQVRRHVERHAGHAQSRRRQRQRLPADQRRLRADPLLPEPADQHRQRRPPASRLDLSDRHLGIAGNHADRGERHDVRDHGIRPRLRARRPHRAGAVALQAEAGTDHHLLLRIEQPRRRGVRRQGLHGDARFEAGRARRQDRQARVVHRRRRSRVGLQRDDGADRGERQDPARHQRRRVRHPRLRQGVRRRDRQAAVDLLYDPGELAGASGQPPMRPERTSTATSTPKRRRTPRTAIRTRRWAAACGRTRRST